MNLALIVVAIFVAGVVVWLALQTSRRQKQSAQLELQLAELRRELQSVASNQAQSSGQVRAIADSVSLRLESVSAAVQEGMKGAAQVTGQITSQAKTEMAEELKNTRAQIGEIQKQLGEVQEAGKQMSETARTLEGILGGAKSRGSFGEVTLERLLEDALPPSQYSMQYRFTSGEAADAVIHLRDKKIMAIDSKFPLDAFRRIASEGDDARRTFATAVKGHADSIAGKYIVPQEQTLDVALMFVPSETVYYELLVTTDSKGLALDAYCRQRNVLAVSPNTLHAHLCVIAMGLRGMQIEENAKHLSAGLDGLHVLMNKFYDNYEKIGTHLKNAQQSYSEADKKFEKAQYALENLVASAAPPESLLDAPLPNPQGLLTLTAEAPAKKTA
ncbi:MAG: DNA recombination protein RmuC [Candidatus Acidiferrum sp.]|jgi:DNA recombination protein RmuC